MAVLQHNVTLKFVESKLYRIQEADIGRLQYNRVSASTFVMRRVLHGFFIYVIPCDTRFERNSLYIIQEYYSVSSIRYSPDRESIRR